MRAPAPPIIEAAIDGATTKDVPRRVPAIVERARRRGRPVATQADSVALLRLSAARR